MSTQPDDRNLRPIAGGQQVSETPPPKPGAPQVREVVAAPADHPAAGAPGQASTTGSEPDTSALLHRLIDERERILAAEGLSNRERRALLGENRDVITMIRGGRVVRSEGLVYAILVFSAVVIVAALIGAYVDKGLREVALTITGTVVGGTLTTIAQKLGTI